MYGPATAQFNTVQRRSFSAGVRGLLGQFGLTYTLCDFTHLPAQMKDACWSPKMNLSPDLDLSILAT